jgi:hypothetical protein
VYCEIVIFWNVYFAGMVLHLHGLSQRIAQPR